MEKTSVMGKNEIEFDESAKEFLKEIAKLAGVLSIIGFVGIGFLGLAGFLFSKMILLYLGPFTDLAGKVITVIHLILIVTYFFPVYYVKKFALNVKKAFRENNTNELTSSFRYLKSHFKYLIIFTISVIASYIYFIVVAWMASAIKY